MEGGNPFDTPEWAAAIGPAASPERLAPIADFVAAQENTSRIRCPDRVEWRRPQGREHVALGTENARPMACGRVWYGSWPRNIHAELRSDRGLTPPAHGSLEAWTRNGVLLLNPSLTVQEGDSASHRGARWWLLANATIKTIERTHCGSH